MSDKLEAKFEKCPCVGYPEETIGYRFYNTLEQILFVLKYTFFLEKEFLLRKDCESKGEVGEVQSAQIDVG